MRHLRVISLIILTVLLGLTAGCSRTVTTIPTFGSQMIVSVTFRGNIDLTKNRYFMVIATNEAFRIPVPPPEGPTLDEFLEPGDTPLTGNPIDYYFTTYYSTWNSYIVVDNLGCWFGRGPFLSGNPVTREAIATLSGGSTNQINFTVGLDYIFGANAVPDNIYFDIVSASYPAGAAKYLVDHIAPPAGNISKLAGSIAGTNDNDPQPVSDAVLDIVSWSVKIE